MQCLLGLKFLDAVGTYVFALEVDHIFCVIAKNAGGLVLFQHNGGAVHINLQGVLFRDVQCAAKLDRKNDPSELVDFTYSNLANRPISDSIITWGIDLSIEIWKLMRIFVTR